MFSRAPELVRALVLGILQGLTEFLPISSSGHLVFLPALLGWPQPTILMAVVVHMGTLLSVVWTFRQDLKAIVQEMWKTIPQRRWTSYQAREGYFICLATVPAALSGYFLQPLMTAAMSSPLTAAYGLFVTAILLGGSEIYAYWRERNRYIEEISWLDVLLMGLGQALALMPGISRSGATMAMGRARGLDRPGIARFSFLMGLPVMLGAGMLELSSALTEGNLALPSVALPLGVSFVASAASGLLAIRLFMNFVKHRGLLPFAFYCLVLGLALLYYLNSGAIGY